ncbi:matrix-remodeling-associated protein 7 isoform X1 [Ornithorhynchus anatinus]|uniref:matrix-remodeling-associated protein 7 isoform X1 n=1 Tax=Ornithorhynchus anatinus TaxID=9258 RepID=UPI0010A93178|nr:matrix-remodeling-associated protein 7 isoform X1 [Ornithorhynchus anatinus]
MEAPAELLAALPLLVTVLVLLLASLWVRRAQARTPPRDPQPHPPAAESRDPTPADAPRSDPPEPAAPRHPEAQSQDSPAGPPAEAQLPPPQDEVPDRPPPPQPPAQGQEKDPTKVQPSEEDDLDSESEKLPAAEEPEEEEEEEEFSFKYSPGKLRGNQYKNMMTKEELEEEQRVQKEQLAAIFKLMKDNTETFGEMSDGDVEEQLKLYDM